MHSQNGNSRCASKLGAVVQLVRIPACHAGGRGFESRPHRGGERRMSIVKLRLSLLILFLCLFERADPGTVSELDAKIHESPSRLFCGRLSAYGDLWVY